MENCEELYKTTTCKDIFTCLDDPHILCRPLNTILALIFTMFYKIITFHSGDQYGESIVDSVREVFEFCKDLNEEKLCLLEKNRRQTSATQIRRLLY